MRTGQIRKLHFLLIVFLLCACDSKQRSAGICLSFDDNYLEQWVEILPLLDRYNAKATFFLTGVGELTEKEISWLHQLEEAGHEIAAHGEYHLSMNTYIKEHSFSEI